MPSIGRRPYRSGDKRPAAQEGVEAVDRGGRRQRWAPWGRRRRRDTRRGASSRPGPVSRLLPASVYGQAGRSRSARSVPWVMYSMSVMLNAIRPGVSPPPSRTLRVEAVLPPARDHAARRRPELAGRVLTVLVGHGVAIESRPGSRLESLDPPRHVVDEGVHVVLVARPRLARLVPADPTEHVSVLVSTLSSRSISSMTAVYEAADAKSHQQPAVDRGDTWLLDLGMSDESPPGPRVTAVVGTPPDRYARLTRSWSSRPR